MYHVEIRENPQRANAFNLDLARLHAELIDPWLSGEVFEFGGSEWIPQRTTMMILEGPELPLHRLGLGRGWTNALHEGKDVTMEVLEAAKAANTGRASVAARAGAGRAPDIERDILARVAVGPLSLPVVWDRAEIVAPDASAGERLVLAEAALNHLPAEGHVELCRGEDPSGDSLTPDEADAVLRAREAWSTDRSNGLFVHPAR
ncbi:MAG TPA: hypothetical protein VHM72_11130 [Solirubrobacteraceae bacterium]|nr:hypothetical protein [Solirubrobacteraceae bacterium]